MNGISYIGKSRENTVLDDGYVIYDVWTILDCEALGLLDTHTPLHVGKFFSKQLGVNMRTIGNKSYVRGNWDIKVLSNVLRLLTNQTIIQQTQN